MMRLREKTEEVSLNDLEIKIVREIRKWRDELLDEAEEHGEPVHIDEIDAGDAAKLASEIALHVIYPGVQIVGEPKVSRKLSEGWEC